MKIKSSKRFLFPVSKVSSSRACLWCLKAFFYLATALLWFHALVETPLSSTISTTTTSRAAATTSPSNLRIATPLISSHNEIQKAVEGSPFQRYDGVVMATSVFNYGPHLSQMKQMLCLFTAAYNRHVNYDILVFTTLPWPEEGIQEFRDFVAPAKFTVVLQGPSLEERVAAMPEKDREFLYKRCGVEDGQQLKWDSFCKEETGIHGPARLNYNWMGQFRGIHIWKHEALANYKYMIWMDTDSWPTKPWANDPMKAMVENDLVLLIGRFPVDFFRNELLKDKMQKAYGRAVCRVREKDGHLVSLPCGDEFSDMSIGYIVGYHHITNLDFYRSESVTKMLELLPPYPFTREWDDQLAVTVPAIMEAPERSWDMHYHNISRGIFHNGWMDERAKANEQENFKILWNTTVRHQWDYAREMCDPYIKHIN